MCSQAAGGGAPRFVSCVPERRAGSRVGLNPKPFGCLRFVNFGFKRVMDPYFSHGPPKGLIIRDSGLRVFGAGCRARNCDSRTLSLEPQTPNAKP